MNEGRFEYIYGPVPSWRLGSSLGIDLLSQQEKVCSYDCLYCQLGKTKRPVVERRLYIPVDKVLAELKRFPADPASDYITLSGRGEPTLARNLGEMIDALRSFRKESIAVITNASLIHSDEVREELARADLVITKLDACSQESFEEINRPSRDVTFDKVITGIKEFRKYFRARLALQVMFMRENAHLAAGIAGVAREISPDEVQINTPLRPCAIEPLGEKELGEIKECFAGLNSISVYESPKRHVRPVSDADTLRRRGKT